MTHEEDVRLVREAIGSVFCERCSVAGDCWGLDSTPKCEAALDRIISLTDARERALLDLAGHVADIDCFRVMPCGKRECDYSLETRDDCARIIADYYLARNE